MNRTGKVQRLPLAFPLYVFGNAQDVRRLTDSFNPQFFNHFDTFLPPMSDTM